METTKIVFGFKGKNQAPLFMIIKEFYKDGELYFAKILFQVWIPFQKRKFMQSLKPTKMFAIVTDSKNPFTNKFEYNFLGWQESVWDDSGYFWTSKECIYDIFNSGHNTEQHPFLFNSKHKAFKHMKSLKLQQKSKVIQFC